MQKRYAVTFSGYNSRRYSRPWIARITEWPVGGQPVLQWGAFVGNDDGGEVEIMAAPGDIIRYGQKDTRKLSGSMNEWAVAEADGTLRTVTPAEARTTGRRSRSWGPVVFRSARSVPSSESRTP
jgi:hypothetical protein